MSKTFCIVAAFAILLGTPLGIPNANGQSTSTLDSVLVFGPSEVQASFSIFTDIIWPSDDLSLHVLGTVAQARPPLEGIPTDDPGAEVTYVLVGWGSQSTGFWDGPGPEIWWGGMFYVFSAGYLRVYADDSPDRDFDNPSTFQDGELLLEGNISECWITSGAGYPCPECYPSGRGDMEFTGGTLFSQVSRDGVGYQGSILQSSAGEAPVDSLLAPGHSYPTHGTLRVYIPVAVRATTWGMIKRRFSPEGPGSP